jgi:hypothetical protein
MPLSRRLFLAASLAAPFVAPGHALALIHPPLKESQPRVQPLGIWSTLARRFEVVQDGIEDITVAAPIQFRSAIPVATPKLRWWRIESGSVPTRATLPIPKDTAPPVPMSALSSGIWTDVPITIVIPREVLTTKGPFPKSIRQAGFRISCEIYDPDSKRRGLYSFVLTVLDRPRSG